MKAEKQAQMEAPREGKCKPMKKHLSVLMLYVRSTLYKFLLLILIMAALQGVFFALAFRGADGVFALNTILRGSRLGMIFTVCFLALCALLCLNGCEFGSRQGYTLSRLRISGKMTFFWQSVSNAGFVFLFWAAQVGITLMFCAVYTAHYPQQQAAMLSFYSNDILHNLFPLEETGILIRNAALLAALAVASASFPVRMRRGERPTSVVAVALICVVFFVRGIGNSITNVLISVLVIAISSHAAYGVCKEAGDAQLS